MTVSVAANDASQGHRYELSLAESGSCDWLLPVTWQSSYFP